MAWDTCPYCPTRLNGWLNMEHHKRKEHPAEQRITEAQKAVGWAEERLVGHIKDKEEYETLDSVLTQNLPDLARAILTKERDARCIIQWTGYEGGRVTIPFDQQIAEDTAWLAQKKAELAALQPTEVTA